jgi:hypothetical protein
VERSVRVLNTADSGMTKHTTKTAAVAVGAMLFDDWFDPIEDARARREFWLCCGQLFLAGIALYTGPSLQTDLSVLAMFLMVLWWPMVSPWNRTGFSFYCSGLKTYRAGIPQFLTVARECVKC